MATKRPHASIHPSRSAQVPQEPSRKKRKPNPFKAETAKSGTKTFKKAHPVNELKSRIRSLRRQLERHDGSSAVIQQEKERALRAAEDELERNISAKRRSDMIGKWHKVRFFDRRKAEKRLKRIKKEAELGGGGAGEQRVRDAEVDVKYAIYYPLEKDYVPLFPRRRKGDEGEEEDAGETERQGDPVMWERVKACMEEGTLDALRNGQLERFKEMPDNVEAGRPAKKRPKQSTKMQGQLEDDPGDDDSDQGGTGFWE